MSDDFTRNTSNPTRSTTESIAEFATGANKQLKAAGVDTDKMANRAGDLSELIKNEIIARPFQAVGLAAFIGFVWGVTR